MAAEDRAHAEKLHNEQIAAQREMFERNRRMWAEAEQRREQAEQQRMEADIKKWDQERLDRAKQQNEEMAQREAEILYQNDNTKLTIDKQDHASDAQAAKQRIDGQQQAAEQMFAKMGNAGGGGLLTLLGAVAKEVAVGVQRVNHNSRYPSERRSVKNARRRFHAERGRGGRKKYEAPPKPDWDNSLERARQRRGLGKPTNG